MKCLFTWKDHLVERLLGGDGDDDGVLVLVDGDARLVEEAGEQADGQCSPQKDTPVQLL